MESLKWLFELRDMLSGPARAMRSAIGDLDQSLKAAKGPLEELQSSLSSATARGVFFGSFVGGIAKQLGGVFLHVVSSAAREVTHLAYAFGKATIGNADLADRMQISLGVMLGFGNAAKKLMSDVVHQAASLPITTQEALGATTAYITGGFGAKEIPKLLTATADVGALNPTHSEEARGVFVDELRRLKQEGFLNERLMFLLPQVVGISGQKIYENLKRLTGAGSVEDVRKLIGQRAIDSDTGIKAILAALRDMEGGALGNLSHQLAHTFTGLLSTLRSRFFEMTEGLADSPAFASLKGVLENLTSLTDTTTAAGRRMMSVIGNAFDAMFGWLKRFSGAAGMERLQRIFSNVINFVEAVPPAMRAVVSDIGAFLDGLFGNVDILKGSWKEMLDPQTILNLMPSLKDLGVSLRKSATAAMELAHWITVIGSFGHDTGQALSMITNLVTLGTLNVGLHTGKEGAAAAWNEGLWKAFGRGYLWDRSYHGLNDPAGSSAPNVAAVYDAGAAAGGVGLSPSAGGGVQTPTPMAAGGIVTRPTFALVGEAGPEPVVPLRKGLGRTLVQNAHVEVHVDGALGADAQTIAEKLREILPSTLQSAFEQMALEAGAA